MKRSSRILPTVALLFMTAATCHAQVAGADSEIGLGVQAFRQGKYKEAIAHFEHAVVLDPAKPVAHLYLATAYAQEYVPDVDTEENGKLGQQAIDEYQKVLDLHPGRAQELPSLKGMASLSFSMKKFDLSKEYSKKVVELDPEDAEAYYSIGVVDWTESYVPRMKERARLGLNPVDPLIDSEACSKIRETNEDRVKEGIEVLTKALELRPDYDDAMAYLNLLYRERADIQCGDPKASEADLETADKWVELVFKTKKAKADAERNQKPSDSHQPQR